MATKKTDALTGAQRTARSVQKRKDAGLIQIKVWVAAEKPVRGNKKVTTEADKVRAYAAKQPLTKAVLNSLVE